ncbi:MAG: phage holin family protein [Steroidobacteraceae bacterium]|nr:phage holin family protein [Steroidobacteraceae bacterium]
MAGVDMDAAPPPGQSPAPDAAAGAARPAAINPLELIAALRSAGRPLFAQLALHGELLRVELAEERNRLLKMAVATLVCFIGLLCTMILAGIVALAFTWDTPYRIPAAIAIVGAFVLVTGLAGWRLRVLSALGRQSFAATREEIAADLALLRSRM